MPVHHQPAAPPVNSSSRSREPNRSSIGSTYGSGPAALTEWKNMPFLQRGQRVDLRHVRRPARDRGTDPVDLLLRQVDQRQHRRGDVLGPALRGPAAAAPPPPPARPGRPAAPGSAPRTAPAPARPGRAHAAAPPASPPAANARPARRNCPRARPGPRPGPRRTPGRRSPPPPSPGPAPRPRPGSPGRAARAGPPSRSGSAAAPPAPSPCPAPCTPAAAPPRRPAPRPPARPGPRRAGGDHVPGQPLVAGGVLADGHRGLRHPGQRGQHGLDLARLDPEPADLDLVIGPAQVLQLPVGGSTGPGPRSGTSAPPRPNGHATNRSAVSPARRDTPAPAPPRPRTAPPPPRPAPGTATGPARTPGYSPPAPRSAPAARRPARPAHPVGHAATVASVGPYSFTSRDRGSRPAPPGQPPPPAPHRRTHQHRPPRTSPRPAPPAQPGDRASACRHSRSPARAASTARPGHRSTAAGTTASTAPLTSARPSSNAGSRTQPTPAAQHPARPARNPRASRTR